MRERDLTRREPGAPAADERGDRSAVVGCTVWTTAGEATDGWMAGRGVDAGDLEGLGGFERREDGRQSPRQHRLAGAGWSAEQEVVAAGRCRVEGPAGPRESSYLGEVEVVVLVGW